MTSGRASSGSSGASGSVPKTSRAAPEPAVAQRFDEGVVVTTRSARDVISNEPGHVGEADVSMRPRVVGVSGQHSTTTSERASKSSRSTQWRQPARRAPRSGSGWSRAPRGQRPAPAERALADVAEADDPQRRPRRPRPSSFRAVPTPIADQAIPRRETLGQCEQKGHRRVRHRLCDGIRRVGDQHAVCGSGFEINGLTPLPSRATTSSRGSASATAERRRGTPSARRSRRHRQR